MRWAAPTLPGVLNRSQWEATAARVSHHLAIPPLYRYTGYIYPYQGEIYGIFCGCRLHNGCTKELHMAPIFLALEKPPSCCPSVEFAIAGKIAVSSTRTWRKISLMITLLDCMVFEPHIIDV